ncbi:TPA: DotD/TraH family lipoprotein [Acinetobacter baumannii]|nr:DotD/TraH family lipoprotein [Acinetobacter baumannii]
MKYNKKYFGILATVLAISGCQSYNPSQLHVSSPLQILSQASQEALIAQQNLKNTTAIHMQQVQNKQLNINHDLINIDYIGDPVPLLKSIASQYSYRFVESGPTQELPIVNFNKKSLTGVEALRDISSFISTASITLDHQNKSILLTYN